MQKQIKKALIIGCGIGGAALALFLKRADIEAEIYEARTTPEGYSLSLGSNGMSVLAELGLARAVYAEGALVNGNALLWNGKNRLLGKVGIGGEGIEGVFIKRVPLGQIISDEAERQGIKILRGKKLQEIEKTSQGGVIATFQDGTTASGDLLIGSDGAHSRTRQIIDPVFPRAVYTGLVNSGGYTSGVKVPSEPGTTNFIFCKRGFFGYLVDASGYIYWFSNWPREEEPARGAFDGLTEAERRQFHLDLYRDDQPFIREIVQGAEEIFPYFLSYTLPTQPASWHKGPVVLLGDAAHAITQSSGQGASMALEDAGILAKCLRDIPDVEQAFTTYEYLRRERAVKMHAVGKQGDSGKHMIRPMQQWLRDLTMPLVFTFFVTPQATAWIYSYRVDWNTKVQAAASVAR